MSNDFRSTTDDALLSLIKEAQGGNQVAFEELLKRYMPLIESMAGCFANASVAGFEHEDLQQEAVIGFYRAMMHFDTAQKKVQFGLFAKICIQNRLTSLSRSMKHYKNVTLLDDEEDLAIAVDVDSDPAAKLVEEETYLELYRRIHETLSSYENRVWWLYLSGRTAKEIAEMLEKDEKSVTNAIFRIRKKLRTVIPYS